MYFGQDSDIVCHLGTRKSLLSLHAPSKLMNNDDENERCICCVGWIKYGLSEKNAMCVAMNFSADLIITIITHHHLNINDRLIFILVVINIIIIIMSNFLKAEGLLTVWLTTLFKISSYVS